jgi:hypothetical protein
MHLDKIKHDLKATEAHGEIMEDHITLVASRVDTALGELKAGRVLYVTRLPDLSPYSANMLLKD